MTLIHAKALTRLRPVLMTALVASLGFVPMAFAREPRLSSTPARYGGDRRHPGVIDCADAACAASYSSLNLCGKDDEGGGLHGDTGRHDKPGQICQFLIQTVRLVLSHSL